MFRRSVFNCKQVVPELDLDAVEAIELGLRRGTSVIRSAPSKHQAGGVS